MNQKTLGILLMLGVGLMWAIQAIFVKYAYQSAGVLDTALVMVVIILIGAAFYSLFQEKNIKRAFSIPLKEFTWIAIIAVFGTLIADILYLYALTNTPIVNVILIGHLQPIFIILLSYFVFRKDIPHVFDYLGIAAMIICAIFISSSSLENLLSLKIGSTGDLLVLIATILWGICAVITRKYLHHTSPGKIVFYRFFVSAVVLFAYLLMTKSVLFSTYFQLLIGLVVAVGYIFYYEAMKRLSAAHVGSLELTAPFFGAILGFILLKEALTSFQMMGMLFLVVGIWFLGREKETVFAANSIKTKKNKENG